MLLIDFDIQKNTAIKNWLKLYGLVYGRSTGCGCGVNFISAQKCILGNDINICHAVN